MMKQKVFILYNIEYINNYINKLDEEYVPKLRQSAKQIFSKLEIGRFL